jgi:hypothetical protein
MANPEFEALKIANDVSLNSVKKKEIEQKNRYQKGEMGIKRAQILSALPSSIDTSGDNLIGAANRMSQGPQNAATGIVEGLLRAFGGNLKGKAADEKRQQIMDALDVLDYTMEGEEYLQKTQEQIAKQRKDGEYKPSQGQYEQAYSDGTLEPTLKATFQQMGVDPNNVQLSSDGLNVFVEKDGQVTKAPVSDFFSPEDSQKFQFINSTQKANLAKSENKQIQGLAQENNTLKSRLQTLEEQFSQMEGISPVVAKSLAQGVVEGERTEGQKLSNETMKAKASKQNSDIAFANAPFDQASKKAYATDVNNRWDPEQVSSINLAKKQAANIADHVVSLKESNHRIDTALHEFSMLESLLNDPKRAVITGDTLKSKAKRFFAGASGSKALSDTELYDAFEKGFFAHFKGDVKFGNMNREQFALEMDQMPHSKFTKQGMLDIIDLQRQKLMAQKERNGEEIKQVPNYTSRLNEMYGGQSENSQSTGVQPTQTGNTGQKAQSGNSTYTKMVKPDGSIVAVPTNKVYEKIQLDYRPIK